jgi:hypothetical protein
MTTALAESYLRDGDAVVCEGVAEAEAAAGSYRDARFVMVFRATPDSPVRVSRAEEAAKVRVEVRDDGADAESVGADTAEKHAAPSLRGGSSSGA